MLEQGLGSAWYICNHKEMWPQPLRFAMENDCDFEYYFVEISSKTEQYATLFNIWHCHERNIMHLSPKVLAKCVYVPLRKFLLYLVNSAVYLRVFLFGLLAVLNTYILQYVSIPAVHLLWLSRIA